MVQSALSPVSQAPDSVHFPPGVCHQPWFWVRGRASGAECDAQTLRLANLLILSLIELKRSYEWYLVGRGHLDPF